MRERIDAKHFCEMVIHAAVSVDACKQDINELNVFPVPDGDTGTNMSMTLNAAARELEAKTPKTLGEAAEKAASAMLRGARGNSGVITSLLFRGISRSLKEKKEATAAEFAAAMNEGVSAAYKAVMKPTEGTILTVSRLASAAAEEAAKKEKDVANVLDAAILAGEEALRNTQELNPVLKKAGVVDAGGVGYMEVLKAFRRVLRGEATAPLRVSSESGEQAHASVFTQFDTEEDITFTYCTEFIVSKDNDKSVDLLRSFLSSIGDSAVVLDDEELIKVHVHSDRPGDVLTEALTYGALQTVKVENMRLQHSAKLEEAQPTASAAPKAAPSAPAPKPAAPNKPLGIVSVCAGEGLAGLFRELGADEIVSGGQTMNPSTEDILRAVEATGGRAVIVLPNNKNIIMAAQQCVGLTDREVIVVPSTTVPQGISAMLALDPAASPAEAAEAMNGAIGGVKTISVTYAARDSVFDGREIREGEYLALQDGKMLANVPDKEALQKAIGEALAACGAEFISIFYGEDVSAGEAEQFSEAVGKCIPDAEISLVSGGQPVYYYLISAE